MTTATSPRLRDRWRTWAWVAGIAAAAIVCAAVVTRAPTSVDRLDPGSVGRHGAHALAQLLTDRGVHITRATTLDQVRHAVHPGSQVLIVDTGYLTDDIDAQLSALPGDRLYLEPLSHTRAYLDRIRHDSNISTEILSPGCDLHEAIRAGNIFFSGETYEFTDHRPGDIRCYEGALVRFSDTNGTVTVVGSDEFLTNAEIGKDGNAALAMNLAGHSDDLVWYLPKRPDASTDPGAPANPEPRTLGDLIPTSVSMAIWQVCLAVLVLAFWRGRRLGPVVAEKLPVVVRASETTEGRARLYRSRRARDRAADALREATCHRIAHRAGLLVDSPPELVADTVGQRIGRSPTEIHHILFGPVPADDHQLITLAQQLDLIERQVRDS